MRNKWIIITLLIAALSLLSLLAMPKDNDETLASHIPSDVVAVAKGTIDVEGGIIHVAASRQGLVTKVLAEEGQQVSKGQILARIDDRQQQLTLNVINSQLAEEHAQLNKLTLEITQAERDLARMKSLVAKASISMQQYDLAKDTFVNLKAEAATQQAKIEKTLREKDVQAYEVRQYAIRAPMDGLIVRRMAQPGQGTSTLDVTDLFLLVPNSERIIRAEVEERFIRLLRPGMHVTITPRDGEQFERPGTIRRIGNLMGSRKNPALNSTDKVDVRVVEVVISFSQAGEPLIIGQQVIVRFKDDTRDNQHKSPATERQEHGETTTEYAGQKA